ncbi:MAG: TonB-dependent receptor [Verrucomicrobiales bacterium]|nr:TonB-dependent receptor [Verrucomicrobiales bacterium]
MKPNRNRPIGAILATGAISALLGTPGAIQAQEAAAETAPAAPAEAPVVQTFDTLEAMTVIGGSDDVFTLPGSGYYVDTEEIQEGSYLNVNRILAKVPGVYVREEDGFGLFPNISIRGGDGTRSEKVTIMEDGILTAPAPYASPSAYYSPNAARMSGIEILKGSSQVRYGPHTTGGVVNYLSTPIPESLKAFQRTTYGSDNTVLTQSYIGDTIELAAGGRVGYLAELWWSRSDGFRTIDGAPGLPASDKTGFDLIEPMFKIFYEPDSAMPMRFEAKYGYTQLDSNETYVGLTEHDLIHAPFSRYAGTYLDNIATEHHRSYLKWLAQPTDNLNIEIAGYYNTFERDWYKIRKAGGADLHKILANPARYSDAFDNLRLLGNGDLDIRANARSYEAIGTHFIGDLSLETGDLTHDFNFGVRYHEDYIRLFQRDDKIVVGSGAPFVVRGRDGSGGNRWEKAEATSLWIEDNIGIGRLSVKPGIRYEHVQMHYTDYKSDPTDSITGSGSGDTSIVAPGVGLNYELSDAQTIFAGIYKGVSAPSPGSHLKDGVEWEESWGYELGARHRGDNGFYGELAGFFSDYENLTGTAAGLGLNAQNATNAGQAEVYGVELLASYDINQGGAIAVPLFASATYTQGTLDSALDSGGGEDILAGGRPGAYLPYIPEWKFAVGSGLQADKWGIDLLATYVSDIHGTARNVASPIDSSREGMIDGGFTVDLSAHYQVSEKLKLIGGIHNLLDETLTTSRIPEGPRSGAPRSFYIGFEMLWEPSFNGDLGDKSPIEVTTK